MQTWALLVVSNVFMTFAWYAHLRNLADKPWWIAVLASWGIAFFEYLLQVPGNRIGFQPFQSGAAENHARGHYACGLFTVFNVGDERIF